MDTSGISPNKPTEMVGLHQSGDRIFHETPVHVSPTAENIQQKYQARESTIWQPVVQYIPQQTFINASPLSSLNMSSAPVDCPMCGARAVTRITFVAGSQTQYVDYYRLLIMQCVWNFIVPIHRPRVSTVYRNRHQRCRA